MNHKALVLATVVLASPALAEEPCPHAAKQGAAAPDGHTWRPDEGAHGAHRGGPLVHGFEDTEKYVAMFESPERAAWQKPDEVVAALAPKEGEVVADIGAGSGYFTRRFAAKVGPKGTVYAIDIEPGMLAAVRKDAKERKLDNIIPILADLDDPNIPPGGVDTVFICDTVHHIADRPAYYRRIAAALRQGGRIVIVDFHERDAPVGPPTEHKLSAEQVTAELAEAGFQVVRTHDLLPHQYVLEAMRR